MMQLIVNVLGTLTAGLCAVLLLRAYAGTRSRLLLWCGLCFAGLTAANGLLIADLALFHDANLFRWRLATAAVSMVLMVYGLIFESDAS
jgi:hypothetical protein